MILIPAVDILAGKPVRLLQGEYDRVTQYGDNPLDAALRWRDAGARWLHVVDLDGARTGRAGSSEAVRSIIEGSGLQVQVGGGLRSRDDVARLFEWGAARAVLGTVAVKDPDLVRSLCAEYPGRIVVALDARGGDVAVQGWRESSGRKVSEVAREVEEAGASRILFTVIEADGGMGGPDIAALEALLTVVRSPVIASGGVGTVDHLAQLERTGVEAVIVGRALYERTIPLTEIRRYADQQC